MKIKVTLKEPGSMQPFKLGWWGPAKVEWAPALLEENKTHWYAETDYEGKPWVKLDPETIKEKDAEGYGSRFILRETGEMFNTAVVRPWGNRFLVDTTPWGVFNQFGTKKMPARPWMGVPDSSLDKLSDIAWKHILK